MQLKESHAENALLETQAEAAASLAQRAIGTVKSLSSVVSDGNEIKSKNEIEDIKKKRNINEKKASDVPKELMYLKNLSTPNKFSQSPTKAKVLGSSSPAKPSPAKDSLTS